MGRRKEAGLALEGRAKHTHVKDQGLPARRKFVLAPQARFGQSLRVYNLRKQFSLPASASSSRPDDLDDGVGRLESRVRGDSAPKSPGRSETGLAEAKKQFPIIQRAKKLATEGKLKPAEEKAALEKLRTEGLTERERLVLEKGVSNQEYHYLGSGKILGGIGKGLAEAMAELKLLKKAN